MQNSFFDRLQHETQDERDKLFSLPIIHSALNGQINLDQYIAFLSQAYHHVKHTVPLLMGCGSRLDGRYEWLRKALAEYIEEEIGHEKWILSDIEVCGGSAKAVSASTPNLATESMVAYAYHQIDRLNPVGFFGMVYVLEGTSTALATNAANVIKQSLNLPSGAFSYLTSHGSLDLEHVKFFEHIMNQLTEESDKTCVINCAKRFYALYGAIFNSLPHLNNT
jgi:pyrroloquinoline quinone (PQQ) biosynthesis protein C